MYMSNTHPLMGLGFVSLILFPVLDSVLNFVPEGRKHSRPVGAKNLGTKLGDSNKPGLKEVWLITFNQLIE